VDTTDILFFFFGLQFRALLRTTAARACLASLMATSSTTAAAQVWPR
jgi:hypothetical protein